MLIRIWELYANSGWSNLFFYKYNKHNHISIQLSCNMNIILETVTFFALMIITSSKCTQLVPPRRILKGRTNSLAGQRTSFRLLYCNQPRLSLNSLWRKLPSLCPICTNKIILWFKSISYIFNDNLKYNQFWQIISTFLI